MESHKRTIVKALSWRVIATLVTILAAWLFTGTVEIAFKIGLLYTLIKLAVYYLHERTWIRLRFGKFNQPEYQI